MNFALIIIAKATLFLILSSLLILLLKKASASLRHWVISLTMIGLLLLPFFTEYLPGFEVEIEAATELPQFIENLQPTEHVMLPAATMNESMDLQNEDLVAVPSQPLLYHESSSFQVNWSLIILISWLSGAVIMLAYLLLGVLSVYLLTKQSQLFDISGNTAVYSSVQLLSCDKIRTPMTWGVINPVILLPEGADKWTTETLKTVIEHEVAHTKRGDYLIQVLSWITLSIYWFHPLVWWMNKQQLLEREKACDEQVLKGRPSGIEYAENLLIVASDLSRRKSQAYYCALPMAKTSQIKERIIAIMKFQKDRFRFTRARQMQWASFYITTILFLAVLTPVRPAEMIDMLVPGNAVSDFLETEMKDKNEMISEEKFEEKLIEHEELRPLETENESTDESQLLTSNNVVLSHSRLQPLAPTLEETPIKMPKYKTVLSEVESITEQEQGYYTTWTSGKSTFEVWKIGSVKLYSELPYIEASSPDAMIVIEEKRKTVFGKKHFRMIISKIPYNGGLVITFRDGIPNSWNGSYKENDPLYMFYVNEEFNFSGNEKLNWLAETLPEITWQMMGIEYSNAEKTIIGRDDLNIRKYLDEKANRFLKYEDLPPNDFEDQPYWKMQKYKEHPPFDFSSVKYAGKLSNLSKATNQKRIGSKNTRKRWTSGGNTLHEGLTYGRIMRDVPAGVLLNDFNFAIRQNDFEKITFELSIYNVDTEGIISSLTESSIRFDVSGDGNISESIAKHGLVTGGENILVLLKIAELEGEVGLDYLFLNLSGDNYKSFHEETARDWGFWESNFAFSFN
ncbi:MAG: M56 family metallopeptidase [Bacteroidota bacterium]